MTTTMNDHLQSGVVNLKAPSAPAGARVSATPVVLRTPLRKYPAEAPTRMFVSPTIEEHVTMLSPRQMIFARAVSAFLIPMILITPIARVYADEVAVVDASAPITSETPSESAATSPLAEEAATATAIVPLMEESTPVVEGATPDAPPADGPDAQVVTTNSENTESEQVTEETPPQEETPLPSTEEVAEVAEVPEDQPAIPEEIPIVDVPTDAGGGGVTPAEQSTTTDAVIPEGETVSGETPITVVSDATSTEVALGDEASEATSTDEVLSEVATTTSEEVVEEGVEGVGVVVDNSAEIEAQRVYQEERARAEMRKEVEREFLRGCISFESSGYYCLSGDSRKSDGGATRKIAVAVASEQGDGGDKEIVVTRDGVRTWLTANDFDDTFPTQDVTGENFVWQGMKGGRWQIYTGLINSSGTPMVSQVTDSRESNFNPKIDGDHLVWQGWADDNWEIFLATKRDAKSPFAGEHLPEGNALLGVGSEWAVERLTANTDHDMFPSLHGDLVTWQSREGADWVVYAYSINAKKQTKLSSDGVKSENPRFSITWEERDLDGHARLVGYDLSTGEKTDLTKEALRLPGASFPEPTSTPITQSDPAALPVSQTSGSSTPQRGDDEGGGDNPILP